ncbi:MAG: PDZ domain-containing protein, partial [Planctomycetota bacterium]
MKTSPVFKEILERVNAGVGAKVYFGEGGQAPSDNTSFYRKKKPVLFFFTGLHLDYHRPSDDTGKVDRMGIEQVARLAAGVAEELALLEERPAFQRADSGGFGPPRAILGISLARAEVGARIRSVLPGGPAAKAGLAVGDVIVEVAGQEIPDLVSLYGVMRDRKI